MQKHPENTESNNPLRMNHTIKRSFVVVLTILSSFFAMDAAIANEEGVVVEEKRTAFQPYLQRRSKIGVLFSAQYEQYNPKDYYSAIQDLYFDEMTDGASIGLAGVELGVKYNFSLGSAAALVAYSSGSLSAESRGLNKFEVGLTKISANLTLDALMKEPYVAPYVQGGVHQFSISEESTANGTTSSEAPAITWNFNYRFGLLFQLNWIEKAIDPNTIIEGFRSSGLENTYIDLFYAEYMRPSQIAEVAGEEGEPDHASSHFGVGLKMEF